MRPRLIALAAATAASLALTTGSASASCKIANVNGVGGAYTCVEADAGASGTTATPTAYTQLCVWAVDPTMWSCGPGRTTSPGTFGATPGSAAVPHVDLRHGTVSSDGGTAATVYAGDPAGVPVNVPGFCVGDPAYC